MSINQIINKEDISMKKMYETPEVEVVKFQYRDQVVAASGTCQGRWINIGENSCTEGIPEFVEHVN